MTFTSFPKTIWQQIWSNNPNERLNREIRRRTDVVGVVPDRASAIRLIGAVPAERHDEWTESRRYIGLEILAKSRITAIEGEHQKTPKTTQQFKQSAPKHLRINEQSLEHHLRGLDLERS